MLKPEILRTPEATARSDWSSVCSCSFLQTCYPRPQKPAQGISGFSADVDEDYAWLNQNAFAKHPEIFPADKFGPEDFRWAVGVALSRSFFVNGELRLIPLVDFANHAPSRGVLEPTGERRWSSRSFFAACAVLVLPH